MMASGFYTVYALAAWDAPPSQAGVFTTLLLAGQVAGNVSLGWLADRMGHRVVIIVGLAATVGANLLALGAPSLATFGAVFVLAAIQGAAISLPHLNALLGIPSTPRSQPPYRGLGPTPTAS